MHDNFKDQSKSELYVVKTNYRGRNHLPVLIFLKNIGITDFVIKS